MQDKHKTTVLSHRAVWEDADTLIITPRQATTEQLREAINLLEAELSQRIARRKAQ